MQGKCAGATWCGVRICSRHDKVCVATHCIERKAPLDPGFLLIELYYIPRVIRPARPPRVGAFQRRRAAILYRLDRELVRRELIRLLGAVRPCEPCANPRRAARVGHVVPQPRRCSGERDRDEPDAKVGRDRVPVPPVERGAVQGVDFWSIESPALGYERGFGRPAGRFTRDAVDGDGQLEDGQLEAGQCVRYLWRKDRERVREQGYAHIQGRSTIDLARAFVLRLGVGSRAHPLATRAVFILYAHSQESIAWDL